MWRFLQSLGVEIMNKLKVGDIVYIAGLDMIYKLVEIHESLYYFLSGERWVTSFLVEQELIHEHMNLGFVIKLEL